MGENEVMPKQSKNTVISFISGKGGVGKTSLSLSIAKLLSQFGKEVLLVDFDLATHEASYFFINIEGYKAKKSISSLLDDLKNNREINIDPIKIEQLDFIPSETDFEKPSKLLEEGYIEHVGKALNRIQDFANLRDYDYIIIDTQAGPVPVTREVIKCSHKVVIMMASDITIGLAAVKNLLHKFDDEVLKRRDSFCIVNELALAETIFFYQIEENDLEGVRLLKPIPFDSGVRLALLIREIPMDIEKVSPFILGVIRNAKELFPELKHEIEGLWQKKETQTQEWIKKYSTPIRGSWIKTILAIFVYMFACAAISIPIIMYLIPSEYKIISIIIAILLGVILLLAVISGVRSVEYTMIRYRLSNGKSALEELGHQKAIFDGYETIKVTEKKN